MAGAASGATNPACLTIDTNLPAWLASKSPFAVIQSPFVSAQIKPFTRLFDERHASNELFMRKVSKRKKNCKEIQSTCS
eukprot:CAMPEP_0182420168 /NCGR_PEP_ID=MMETSP1167-20130531/4746_1 /TAXON_ID=2988 /ORGANISM="Mallomonas Sp, Strain CCMP3275" /LENGTH=78 /DNA_ID=CAMNT_0024595719 /DNA_START=248 /DNA_END=484 /DNA_ORIENTATION=+